MSKYLITQTLVSAYHYALAGDNGYEDFLSTLRRERKPPTKMMLEGRRFESVINAVCDGAEITEEHEWYKPVTEIVEIVKNAQQQVRLYRDIQVGGVPFLVNGVIDFLLAAQIFDAKYSQSYRVGRYLNSPQTPFYFYLIPEARSFTYLVSEGKYLYKETYRPDEVEPIENTIKHFMAFLDRMNLTETYKNNWRSKY